MLMAAGLPAPAAPTAAAQEPILDEAPGGGPAPEKPKTHDDPGENGTPVPANVVVRLEAESQEFLIGENALAHFTVAASNGTAAFEWGGDYRGCPRAIRFKVSAVGPDGMAVKDPYPQAGKVCFGGLGGTVTVSSTNSWTESLSLPRYLLIEQPGEYLVTVSHDGGWQETPERPFPQATTTVRFRLPAPEETKNRVAAWLATRWHGDVAGKKAPPHPDWEIIRHPLWLGSLTDAARQGHRPAIAGIHSIRTVEATGVLLSLLHTRFIETKDRTFFPPLPQAQILQALSERLASAVVKTDPSLPAPAVLFTQEQKDALREEVRNLIAGDDQALRRAAGQILGTLGSKADLPLFLAALEKAATADQDGPYLDVNSLLAAYARIAGEDAPPPPTTVAGTLVWLGALPRKHEGLSAAQRQDLAACFAHALPTVRQAAIEAVAKPWPKIWVPELRKLLADPSPRVRWYACTRADETGAKELIPDLVRLLDDRRCNLFAGDALVTLGGRLAAIQAWLDLGIRGWSPAWQLIAATSPCGSLPDEVDLAPYLGRVRVFVEAHAAKLEKGPMLPDQTWPTGLLPETMWLQLRHGNWPQGRGPKDRE
jgi:hypothetical protein